MSQVQPVQTAAVDDNEQVSLIAGIRSACAVFSNDIKCELRARHALESVVLFAVTSTVAVSFTLSAWGANSAVASAMLWIIIYFAAISGLSRSFVREQETGTADMLRLAAPPNSVFVGKLAFNFCLMLAIGVVTVPLFLVLMGCSVQNWVGFVGLFVCGSIALSVGATASAAMVARASGKAALFAVISFPLLIPVLAVAIYGTDLAMRGGSGYPADMRLLVYYSGLVFTASMMLFRFIWED